MFYHNLHLMLHFLLSTTYNPAEPDTELRIVPSSFIADSSLHFLRELSHSILKMSLIIFHLLLCLSLHACSARPLQVNTVEGTGGLHQVLGKETRPAIIDEYSRVKETVIERIGEGLTLASCCEKNIMQQKISEELGGRNEKIEGNNMALSSTTRFMHDMIKVEDQRRQARILKSLPSDNSEESIGAKENDMGEDIVVMDYAQPHRKPPIHNKQP